MTKQIRIKSNDIDLAGDWRKAEVEDAMREVFGRYPAYDTEWIEYVFNRVIIDMEFEDTSTFDALVNSDFIREFKLYAKDGRFVHLIKF